MYCLDGAQLLVCCAVLEDKIWTLVLAACWGAYGIRLDLGAYFAITPSLESVSARELISRFNGSPVRPGFSYVSNQNAEYLTVDQLRDLIKRHIDPTFDCNFQ
ncbi:MAG: hypothetical protein EBS53_14730 [Bacteroidetes bacterium]|nr:hypothetical protein [Bacteroidota bacterium]